MTTTLDQMAENTPGARRTPAEVLGFAYVAALHAGDVAGWEAALTRTTVLIDDVAFFDGKRGVQGEMVRVAEWAADRGHRWVFGSSLPLSAFEVFREASWTFVSVPAPTFEERVEAAQAIARRSGSPVEADVAIAVAEQTRTFTAVRGLLCTAQFAAAQHGKQLTAEVVRHVATRHAA